jgi:NAD-dependent deacetylase
MTIPPETIETLCRSRSAVVLTGAGVSAESGLPTFRGPQGWWRKMDPTRLATPEAFARDPALVWQWYEHRRTGALSTQPGAAHLAVATLQKRVPCFTLITQNVDGLHHRAGSSDVVELHGNLTRSRCVGGCGVVELDPRPLTSIPPTCTCGRLLRPDVVWFGESLPTDALRRALDAVSQCDFMLVVGTSATVYPAANLPLQALRHGAYVMEVNPEPTPLTPLVQLSVHAPASKVLPVLVREAFGEASVSHGEP